MQISKARGVRHVLSFTLLVFSLGGCAGWVRKEDARGGEVHDHFTSRNASLVYTYDIPLTVTAFEAGLRRL